MITDLLTWATCRFCVWLLRNVRLSLLLLPEKSTDRICIKINSFSVHSKEGDAASWILREHNLWPQKSSITIMFQFNVKHSNTIKLIIINHKAVLIALSTPPTVVISHAVKPTDQSRLVFSSAVPQLWVSHSGLLSVLLQHSQISHFPFQILRTCCSSLLL